MVKDDTYKMLLLGGNHFTTAVQELLQEERENEAYAVLRDIDIELYVGLNQTEAHFIASLHNRKCITRDVTFQEKVKLCQQIYNLYTDTPENWKNVATVSLGYLCGKTLTKDSISVILSAASYSEENFGLVENIFNQYQTRNAYCSYPQRSLLPLSEESRTPYLSRAIGTNGLKQSKQAEEDKSKQNLKNLFVQHLDLDNWEETEELYPDEVIELLEFADLHTTSKNVPVRILDSLKTVKDGPTRNSPHVTVKVCIKVDGVESSGQKITSIKQRYENKIKREICKIKSAEE